MLHNCQEDVSDKFSMCYVSQNENEALMLMELLTDEQTTIDLDTIDEGMDELRDVLKKNLIN